MGAPLVDDGRHRFPLDVIETASDEREVLRGEIDDRGREVEPAVEPGLDGVLIARLHVDQMVALQRAQMRRYHIAQDALILLATHDEYDQPGRQRTRKQAAHGEA